MSLKSPLCVALMCWTALSAELADGQLLPRRATLDRFNLTQMWWGQANLDPKRDKIRNIMIDETGVYVVATSGLVTAFDSENGRQVWSRQLGFRDTPAMTPVSNEELILVISGTKLFALSKVNGEAIWHLRLPGRPAAEPALDDEQVYLGMLDGSIYAYRFQDIIELRNKNLLPQYTANARQWRFKAPAFIATQPITNGRVVVVGTKGNHLISITANRTSESQLNFVFQTDNPVSAPLATYTDETGDYVFMAVDDYKLHCLNMNSGLTRWPPFATGLPIHARPVVVGDRVFLLPVRGGMYSINVKTGKSDWHHPRLSKFIAASEEYVYGADTLGNFVMTRRADGRVMASTPMREYSLKLSNIRTDRIVIATPSGRIVCLRQKDLPYAIYHLHPERRPILPQFAPDDPPPPAAGDTGE